MRMLVGSGHAGRPDRARLDEHDAGLTMRAFLRTGFEGERHGRLVDQIADMEGRSE